MAAMAAFRPCLRNVVKPINFTFYARKVDNTSLAGLTKVSNINPSESRRMSICSSATTETQQYRSSSGGGNEGKRERLSGYSVNVMFVPAVLKSFFGSDSEEDSSPEKDLINSIKRSIHLMQNGEPEKAERLLHIALKMAQDLRHEKGITYVYDTMANLAFDNEEYAKAQRLFVEVLRRLISQGMPQDDIVVVNISLKIADTFAALNDYEKSEQGFLFCLDTLKKKISAGAQDEDTLVLYSQALDRYSLFLLHTQRSNEAVPHIENALDIAVSVYGDSNNKVGAILLSDMGAIKTAVGDKEAANQCFDKALKIAELEEVDTSTAVIMVNRGLALKENANYNEAKYWCELGLKYAIIENNKSVKRAAEDCLRFNNKSKQNQSSKKNHTNV